MTLVEFTFLLIMRIHTFPLAMRSIRIPSRASVPKIHIRCRRVHLPVRYTFRFITVPSVTPGLHDFYALSEIYRS